MDDDKKKLVKIIAIVACLILAIGITVITNTGGGGGGYDPKTQVTLMCTNEDCEEITDVTNEEYDDMARASMIMPGMGPMPVECPACGEKSAMRAEVCEKCEEVFIMDYTAMDDYPDRCPNEDCGYSRIEDRKSKKK